MASMATAFAIGVAKDILYFNAWWHDTALAEATNSDMASGRVWKGGYDFDWN